MSYYEVPMEEPPEVMQGLGQASAAQQAASEAARRAADQARRAAVEPWVQAAAAEAESAPPRSSRAPLYIGLAVGAVVLGTGVYLLVRR